MTKNMVLEYINGKTEENIMDNFLMINKKVMVDLLNLKSKTIQNNIFDMVYGVKV